MLPCGVKWGMERSGTHLPAIHALLLVRDEEDIIAQCLDHLLSWAAGVYVLDTGSTDGTWEIISERAVRERRIVAPARTDALYRSGLRARLVEAHRHRFGRGDWLARVDADEFYHVDPREFVRDRVARHEARVAMWQYLFVVTRSEARDWRQRRETTVDRARPIERRRRFYRLDPFPEQRLFRWRRGLRWDDRAADPCNPGPMAAERIPVRHYRFRDLAQMRVRERLRRSIAAQTELVGRHWERGRLRRWIVRDDHPALHCWEPGTPLRVHEEWPEASAHLSMSPCGRVERWCHRAGLVGLLDVARSWGPSQQPEATCLDRFPRVSSLHSVLPSSNAPSSAPR